MSEPIEHDFIATTKSRFDSAELAFKRMIDSGRDYESFEIAWVDFLTATQSFFEKFEQASKRNPKIKSIYDPFKSQRKNDELLQYVHQARHSEEHLISRSGAYIPGQLSFHVMVARNARELARLEQEQKEIEELVATIPTNKFKALPVRNRGIVYPVPTSQLGKASNARHPNQMAALTIQFMRKLLDEAVEQLDCLKK